MTVYSRLGCLIGFALASVFASSSAAQAPPASGWAKIEDGGATAALVRFSNGIDIMIRCRGAALDGLIGGLPPATTRSRELRLATDEIPNPGQQWFVAEDPAVAFSETPARFARFLRTGGQLNLVIPGAGANGRNLRYVMDLPTDASAIENALTACDKPLQDPRDAMVEAVGDPQTPGSFSWMTRPRPIYPEGATTYDWGFASMSCLTKPDGTLEQCQVEAQNPPNGPFGAAALRGAQFGRVQVTDQPDAPVPLRVVVFATRFDMQGGSDDDLPPMRPRSRH